MSRVPRIRFKGFEEDWEQRKFDEVFDCTIPNNTLSRAELNYDSGSVRNVHYGDILIKYGSVVDVQNDEIPFATGKCSDDFKDALLQNGDIIIADTAEDETTGKACEIGNLQGVDVVSGLHTMVCRPRKKMALGYLGYYLNSDAYHHQLLPLMQGIKVLSLSKTNVQKTIVYYPKNKGEQELIAGGFHNLDNLITLHQSKSFWYILKSILSCTLYWEQRKLISCLSLLKDGTHGTHKDYPSGPLLLSAKNIKNGRVYYDETDRRISYKDFEKIHSNFKLQVGDVLLTIVGSIGETALLQNTFGLTFQRSVAFLRVTDNIIPEFLMSEINTSRFKNELENRKSTSAQPGIYLGDLGEIPVFISKNLDEQLKIGSYFDSLNHLITLHQLEPFQLIFKAIAYRIIDYAKSKPPRCIK